jgi:hypothetical protein
VYIVLTWDFYGNDCIVFPEIIPLNPLTSGKCSPLLGGHRAGDLVPKKMIIFFFVIKKSATFAPNIS